MNDRLASAEHEDRLARWVREHGRAVRGFLMGMLRDADLADDLAQEVFARAWQARDRYRESGQERAYLLRIADRLVCDRRRRPTREVMLDAETWRTIDPVDIGDEPHAAIERNEAERQLAAALDALSEAQRRTLLLRYFGGMEFREIAGTLGCPLGTVLSHCRRGLLALRQLLVENIT